MTSMKRGVLILSILVCLLAGGLGSLFTSASIPTWYAGLNKPWFNPPNWLFAPVWTTLFVLMGVSLYLIASKGLKNVRLQVILFGVQLVLNVVWSILFFGLRLPSYAFAEILALWVAIALTIVSFFRVSRKAAMLLLPYILWVSIASLLNYYVWALN